jgi:AcrR family transcriptional regulator
MSPSSWGCATLGSVARPLNADSHATQARIKGSALTLFSERGVGATSVREVAKGAGVSVAMINHYFGSKEGLYAACIDAMYAELSGLSEELGAMLARSDGDPRTIMETAVRLGFRFARTHQVAVRLLQRLIVDAGEVDAVLRDARVLPFLDGVSTALSALTGREAGTFRLPLQSAMFLVVRYSISPVHELALLVGPKRAGDPLTAVEDHIVDATLRLLDLRPS